MESTQNSDKYADEIKRNFLLLVYHGKKSDYVIKSKTKWLNKLFPETVTRQIALTSRKLSFYFNMQNKMKFKYKHDVIYDFKCPKDDCLNDYIDGRKRRIGERMKDQESKDTWSNLLKPKRGSGQRLVPKEILQL